MIETLQSLRFIFVMLIFLSHFAYRDIRALDAGGDCGVAFFFLLSGFACSLGYGRQLRDGTFRYGHFLWRRLRKLYPLHLLCLLAWVLLGHSPLNLKVLLNLLLLQSWVPDAGWYFSCNSRVVCRAGCGLSPCSFWARWLCPCFSPIRCSSAACSIDCPTCPPY